MIYLNMSPNVTHLIIVLKLMVHSDVTNKDSSSVKVTRYVTSTAIDKCDIKFELCTKRYRYMQ
jgi:hypothetical protein